MNTPHRLTRPVKFNYLSQLMQTILLTGATGYLGSQIANAFVCAKHRVAILTRKNSNLSRINSLLPNLQVFNLEDGLDKPFRILGKVHAVVHTATCYGRKGETPLAVFEANTVFPLRLLEIATNFGADSFFNTDTVLNEYINTYSLSKHQFAEWGKSFASEGAIKFINIQLEHFYGPGDDAQKFTSYVIRSCLNNLSEIKLTAGEQSRDFVHVDDVVRAYTCLVDKATKLDSGYHNCGVGSGQSVSLKEFVNKIHRLTNSRSKLMFGALPYRKYELLQSQADTSLLEEIGWNCQLSLEQGLEQTIDEVMRSRKIITTGDG